MLRDLKNELLSGVSLRPAARTTNTDCEGIAVDLANGTLIGMAILDVGTASGTGGPNINVKLQSNTTSATTGFTDITGATFTQVITSNQREVITFQMPVGHNYVRATATIGGTTSPSFTCALEILSHKKYTAISGQESGASRSPST